MRRLLSDVLSLQVASGVQFLVQALATVGVALLLGARDQGALLSAVTLQTVLWSPLNFSLPQGMAAQIAAAAAGGRDERVADWLAYGTKATLVFGSLCLVVGAWLLPIVAESLFGRRDIGHLAAILCLLPLVELPRSIAAIAFQGLRRMSDLARLESGHGILRGFLMVAGALVWPTPLGPVVGMVFSSLLASILGLGLYLRGIQEGTALPHPGQWIMRFSTIPLRRGGRLARRIVALKNVHYLACHWVPRLALGALAGFEWVAYFHVAERIIGAPVLLTNAVSRTLLPAFGELVGQGQPARARQLFRRSTLLTGGTLTVTLALVLICTPWFTARFFPGDYAAPVLRYVWILTIAGVAQVYSAGTDAYLIATNRIREWIQLSLVGVAVAVPASVWLMLEVPITGPAWGSVALTSWLLVLAGYAWVAAPRSTRSMDVRARSEGRG